MRWDQLLANGGAIVADGGMGTTLISMGLKSGSSSELWNVERPNDIRGTPHVNR